MSRPIRFQPDPLDHALIDFNSENEKFTPTAVGLILNESFAGCALVIKTTETVQMGQMIKVQAGRLAPMVSKVVWVQAVDALLIKVGVQFLE
jgi:hypothetical protein